jgi:hypothetical protein
VIRERAWDILVGIDRGHSLQASFVKQDVRCILNVVAAVFLAFIASLVYLSFAFVYRRRPVGFETPMTRGMRA